jgi:hypothetical protein
LGAGRRLGRLEVAPARRRWFREQKKAVLVHEANLTDENDVSDKIVSEMIAK